jgi:RNA polymerase subunit RPABC4/transcription elongation factor Spt4
MIELRTEDLLLGLAIYAGVVGIAFWLAMIVWAHRDMKARSRDGLMRLLVGLFVALLNLPGLLIYLFLRPRETLAEAYERSLEEEALLQEIEEKPVCPTCGIRTQAEWQVCPSCHTRLKKACVKCRYLMELSWKICPHCATSQVNQQAEWIPAPQSPPVSTTLSDERPVYETPESLEFIDSDEY